jgi:hypothetical protein
MNRDAAQIIREGLVAGLVLYATVAVFFALTSLVGGHSPFHTVRLLGGLLVTSTPGALAPHEEWAGALAFNGVHLVASLALGIIASAVTRIMEVARDAWYFFFFLFVAGAVAMIAGLGVLTAEFSHIVPWYSVAVAHLAGALAATLYLVWAHHGLGTRLRSEDF